MDMFTTITPRFQVHIPVAVRKKVGMTKHGRAIIRTDKKKIIIEQVKSDFLSLGGKYKVKNPIPAEKIRGYIDYADGKR